MSENQAMALLIAVGTVFTATVALGLHLIDADRLVPPATILCIVLGSLSINVIANRFSGRRS